MRIALLQGPKDPVLERVTILAREAGVPILDTARPGDVLADLTPLVPAGR